MSFEYHNIKLKNGAELVAAFTDGKHVHVSTPRDTVLELRGVEYRIGDHIHQWANGTWNQGSETQSDWDRRQALHITRAGLANWSKPVSESARKAIGEMILEAIREFVNGNSEVLVEAEKGNLLNEVERAERNYAEAMSKADEARKIRDKAQETFFNFLKGVQS